MTAHHGFGFSVLCCACCRLCVCMIIICKHITFHSIQTRICYLLCMNCVYIYSRTPAKDRCENVRWIFFCMLSLPFAASAGRGACRKLILGWMALVMGVSANRKIPTTTSLHPSIHPGTHSSIHPATQLTAVVVVCCGIPRSVARKFGFIILYTTHFAHNRCRRIASSFVSLFG